MERTRRDTVCYNTGTGCESTLTRFVWAGDQLLWELRVPGGNEVVGSGLESTSASGDFYGRVSYFHAGGIDKPLLITKESVESVVPRETWRGQFHKGTSPSNGAVRDCTQGGQTGCLLIAWPGWKTSASHAWGSEAPDIQVWYGGLVDGMRDASGQMYMRNRYYDPATGQFTQPDPIGLAGGLNAYGFTDGDPVSYADPYGLKVCFHGTLREIDALKTAAEEAIGAEIWLDSNHCISKVGESRNPGLTGLRNRLEFLRSRSRMYNVFFGKRGDTEDEAILGIGAVVKSSAEPECLMADCEYSVVIGSGWKGNYRSNMFLGMCVKWGGSPTTISHLFAHELLGHGFEFETMTIEDYVAFTEMQTIQAVDNVFNAATNRPARCSHRSAWYDAHYPR